MNVVQLLMLLAASFFYIVNSVCKEPCTNPAKPCCAGSICVPCDDFRRRLAEEENTQWTQNYDKSEYQSNSDGNDVVMSKLLRN